jgi:hypothetical protein
MIKLKIQFEGKKINVGTRDGSLGFQTAQMLKLGSFANKTVIARARSGVGSDDTAFPPLSNKTAAYRDANGKFLRQQSGYADWKAKHGLSPTRDMWGPGKGGHMLDNSTVRYADDNSVKIAFTSRTARTKALANEKRTPFYSFSDADEKKILAYAAELFRSTVERITKQFKGKAA